MPALVCTNCGKKLLALQSPLAEDAVCDSCGVDLHACKMCRHYDVSSGAQQTGHCTEPSADPIEDRETANSCGYFEPEDFPEDRSDPLNMGKDYPDPNNFRDPKYKNWTEEELAVAYLQKNDGSAGGELYRRVKNDQFGFIIKTMLDYEIKPDDEAAKEIQNTVWAKVIDAKAKYKPIAKFKTYLNHNSRNATIDWLRKKTTEQDGIGFRMDETIEHLDQIIANRPRLRQQSPGTRAEDYETGRSTDTPEDEILKQEKRKKSFECLAKLSEEHQEVLRFFLDGRMSVRDIADTIGKNYETAKGRLRFARLYYQRCMRRYLVD